MRGPEIAEDVPPDTDRVLTIPNLISLARLAGIPFFILLLSDGRRVAAAIALSLIAGTDWIDGGLARRWHQVTTLGKILDPVIDRFLLLAAFIALLIDGSLPVWLGVFLLTREVLIGIGGVILGVLGVRRLAVTWHGKVYAFGIMAALPFFLLGNTHSSVATVSEIVAWVLIIPSAVLSWVTAVEYARKGGAAVRAGKSGASPK